MYGLKQYHHLLLSHQFTLCTDHAALTYLLKTPDPVDSQPGTLINWLSINLKLYTDQGFSTEMPTCSVVALVTGTLSYRTVDSASTQMNPKVAQLLTTEANHQHQKQLGYFTRAEIKPRQLLIPVPTKPEVK